MAPPPTGSQWAERYARGETPWDHGAAHPELLARLAAGALTPPFQTASALVPGCGRGHDALALARAGWRVTALDLVGELGDELQPELALLGGCFEAGDALSWARHPVQLLFDHTFFCAIEPQRRAAFGELARTVVEAGGEVVSLMFPVDKDAALGGPPYGFGLRDLQQALGSQFLLTEHSRVEHAIPSRSHAQQWARFTREVRPTDD